MVAAQASPAIRFTPKKQLQAVRRSGSNCPWPVIRVDPPRRSVPGETTVSFQKRQLRRKCRCVFTPAAGLYRSFDAKRENLQP